MKKQFTIVALLVTLVLSALFVAAFVVLGPRDAAESGALAQQQQSWLFAGILGVLGLLAGLVFWLAYRYLLPLGSVIEETSIIFTANPSHRIEERGGAGLRALIGVVNGAADTFEAQQEGLQERIDRALADLEQEKQILTSVMSEVAEGVLICTLDGKISLYNQVAREMLGQKKGANGAAASGGFVGLGRSVFGVVDRHLVIHAMEELSHRLQARHHDVVSHFVMSHGTRLLRVRALPVLGEGRALTGFILVLYDETERVEVDSRRDYLLQTLTEGVRANLASIRAAIENLRSFPGMTPEQEESFQTIILDKSLELSALLDRSVVDYSRHFRTQWPLETMLGLDLLQAIVRRVEQVLDVHIAIRSGIAGPTWVRVDSYAVVQAMAFLVQQVREVTGTQAFTFRTSRRDRFVEVDLVWEGEPIHADLLRTWEQQQVATEGRSLPYTLQEVVDRHSGEIWSRSDEGATAYLRLLLPVLEHADVRTAWYTHAPQESRPVFYDFDLFEQAEQRPELDQRLLTDLTYTVFDTETTGLRPSEGDEIISIGAVRIVNGRLLHDEVFEQLVDPQRPLSLQSIRVHGIQPEMLKGAPTIDEVLPRFYRFVEDTVLVAHNAAFDMRFLKLHEKRTGLVFDQAVLDTLLLSAVVHPSQTDHGLDAIAGRFGVEVVGRHTALGDALTTGEILLKLIALLSERGINTLGAARRASQQTTYARIEY